MEDKILIKNVGLRQLKGYTATHFLREYSDDEHRASNVGESDVQSPDLFAWRKIPSIR